jgi:hypothetical protein
MRLDEGLMELGVRGGDRDKEISGHEIKYETN